MIVIKHSAPVDIVMRDNGMTNAQNIQLLRLESEESKEAVSFVLNRDTYPKIAHSKSHAYTGQMNKHHRSLCPE